MCGALPPILRKKRGAKSGVWHQELQKQHFQQRAILMPKWSILGIWGHPGKTNQ